MAPPIGVFGAGGKSGEKSAGKKWGRVRAFFWEKREFFLGGVRGCRECKPWLLCLGRGVERWRVAARWVWCRQGCQKLHARRRVKGCTREHG